LDLLKTESWQRLVYYRWSVIYDEEKSKGEGELHLILARSPEVQQG
jgi:hypothetical protein